MKSVLSGLTKQAAPRKALNKATLPDYRLENEYHDPYMAWKNNPSPENTGNLVKAVKPVIDKGLKSYGGGSDGASRIMRGKAKQIAMDSLESYDPKRAKLQTHLMEHLKGLQRYGGKRRNVLAVPERVLLDRKHLDETTRDMEDWLGREPSDKELADKTGLSIKRIKYVRSLRQPTAEGTIADWQSQNAAEGQTMPAVQQQENDAWVNFVYHDLTSVKNSPLPVVMEYTLGLHGKPKLTTAQLAQKLGVSPGRVAQYRSQIQAKLDQQDELNMRF
tara:strand:- start:6440 stop:7264 length:825 start_codon:yes stop_codon:yes gene_type:complete